MEKAIRKIMLFFVMGLLSLAVINVDAASRELKIDSYTIQADIQEDGAVVFSEEMTFDATGSYNGVFYNLDVQQIEAPADVRVEWKQSDGNMRELTEASTGEDGTYEVNQEDGFLRYKVYLPFTDTRRTVIFHYTLPHLVTNYSDTAELNRRVVGANWEIPQENIFVHVRLPKPATQETLRAWGHGGTGSVAIDSDHQGVTFTVASNDPGNFVEAHVIFPETVTSQNTNRIDEPAFARIVAAEEMLIQNAKRQQTVGESLLVGSGILLIVVAVWAWLSGFEKNRRRLAKVPFVPDHLFEIPEPLTPAMMEEAIYDQLDMDGFSATVMDLVQKRVLRFDGEQTVTITLLPHTQKLKKHEAYVLEIFFRKIANSNTIRLEDITIYAEKYPKKYGQMMDHWMEFVEEESEPYSVTSFAKGESRAQNLWAIVAMGCVDMIVFVGMVLAGLSVGQFLGIFAGVAILNILIFYASGVGQVRRSLEGEFRYRQWNAFRNMLVDLSNLDRAEVASIQIWDQLLVYAIAFGIAKEVISVLKTKFPEVINNSEFYSAADGGQWMLYQQAIAHTMATSYQTVQTSNASSANHGGFGGGFSGGSSMGSGGASGGGGF